VRDKSVPEPIKQTVAFDFDDTQCKHCGARLLPTDDSLYGVCSSNCDSRLVPIDKPLRRRLLRLWGVHSRVKSAQARTATETGAAQA
jgi:hypothetical protein